MYRPTSVRVASLRPACPSRRSVSWLPWRHAVAARLDGPAMLGFVQARREVRTRSGRPGPLINLVIVAIRRIRGLAGCAPEVP